MSCDNSGSNDSVRDDARSSLRDIPENSVTPPVAVPGTTIAGTVHHYICPNNCEGSGGPSQGTCPVCGSDYQHNQAYHDQPSQTTTPSTTPSITPSTTTTTPEPAQNAAGVWHYTCPNGCAGGAGSAGTCSSCGGDLAHNSAYHN